MASFFAVDYYVEDVMLFLIPPSRMVIIGCVTVLRQARMIVAGNAVVILAGAVTAEQTAAAFAGCTLFRVG